MTSTSDRVYAILLGVISGGMVGVVAALTHRALMWGQPVGIAGVVLMLAAFAIFNRLIGERSGLIAGLATLLAVLTWFYMSIPDLIIVPDIYGLILIIAVVLTGAVALAWPESRRSHQSRNGLESVPAPGMWLESPREND